MGAASRVFGHAVSMSSADVLRFRDVQAVQTKGAAVSTFGGVSAATRLTSASTRKSSLSIYSLASPASSTGSMTASPERPHSRGLSRVTSKDSRAGQESTQVAAPLIKGGDVSRTPMTREELMRRLAESAGGRAALAAAAAGAGEHTLPGSSAALVPQPPAIPPEKSRLGGAPKRAISFYNFLGKLAAVAAQETAGACEESPASCSTDHPGSRGSSEGEVLRVDVRRAKSFCDIQTSVRAQLRPATAAVAPGVAAHAGLPPITHSSSALVPTSPTYGALRSVARGVPQSRPHSAASHVRFAVPSVDLPLASPGAHHHSSHPASPAVMSHLSDDAYAASTRGVPALNPTPACPARKEVPLTQPLLSAPTSSSLGHVDGHALVSPTVAAAGASGNWQSSSRGHVSGHEPRSLAGSPSAP
jgi:hypothetical protein